MASEVDSHKQLMGSEVVYVCLTSFETQTRSLPSDASCSARHSGGHGGHGRVIFLGSLGRSAKVLLISRRYAPLPCNFLWCSRCNVEWNQREVGGFGAFLHDTDVCDRRPCSQGLLIMIYLGGSVDHSGHLNTWIEALTRLTHSIHIPFGFL